MSVAEKMDAPSMEDILGCIRRIIAEEQAAEAHVNADGNPGTDVLVLTRMFAPDGSLVSITPDLAAKGRAAMPSASRDPFVQFEALKRRVAALTL